MLSPKDMHDIDNLFDKKLEEKLNEKFKFYPTKDELFTKLDKLMKEIKDMREEFAITTGYKDQIEDHEMRIEKVEKHLHISPQ